MASANGIGFENRTGITFDATDPIDELLLRLRDIRRRIERWVPSSSAMALWSTDYGEVFGAATRLEETVTELDSHLGASGALDIAPIQLKPLLDVLESRANDFEQAVIRTAAVA